MTATQNKTRIGRKDAPPATPATPAPAAPAPAPAAKSAPSDNELSIEQVNEMIAGHVAEAVKGLTPEASKSQVTEESVKTLIAQELAKISNDSKTIPKEDLKEFIKTVTKAQFDAIKMPKINVNDPADAERGGQKSQVEFAGYSLRKGNLPTHMKQLLNICMRKSQDVGIDQKDIDKALQHEDFLWQSIKVNGAKALTTTGTGTGAEWVPRNLSSELYRRMYLESMLIQSYMATEVDMPTDPYDYPLRTTRPVFKKNNRQLVRPIGTTQQGTDKFTLTTQKLQAITQFSDEADEDSIIPILPQLQQDLADAAAAALEGALINGDTTASHMDGDVTDPDDAATLWKGFRKLALAGNIKSDLATGGLSRANLLSLPKLMGKWGAKTSDLLWIVGTKGWNTLMNLDEVVNFYQRGSVGNYVAGGPPLAPWGGSLILSEAVKENVNASGVFDNSVTTKGTILCVNRKQFVFGSRRAFTVKIVENPYSGSTDIIASMRKAFQPIETPSTSLPFVAIGYNWTA